MLIVGCFLENYCFPTRTLNTQFSSLEYKKNRESDAANVKREIGKSVIYSIEKITPMPKSLAHDYD